MTSICASCNGAIQGPCVQALGKKFHPDHFCCTQCKEKLTGKIFTHQDNPICERCYNGMLTICGSCKKPIFGQSVRALDKKWHKECFVCSSCQNPLGGSFVHKDGLPFCSACFSNSAVRCFACGKDILDKVCNALDQTWHVSCFTCTVCNQPFTNGKIFEKGGKPYCEEHLISTLGERRNLPKVPQTNPGTQQRQVPQKRGSQSRRVPPRRIAPLKNMNPSKDDIQIRPNSPISTGRNRPVSMDVTKSQIRQPNASGPAVPPNTTNRIRMGPKVISQDKVPLGSKPLVPMKRGSTTTFPNKPLSAIPANVSKPVSRGSSEPNSIGAAKLKAATEVKPITKSFRSTSVNEMQENPEAKLAGVVIQDLRDNLSWFGDLWDREPNKEACFSVLVKDLHDALVNTKKSGPLQVKSWTRSIASLNLNISAEQLETLTEQIEPLFQNVSNLMATAYNISMQYRVQPEDITTAISNIHCLGGNIMQVIGSCCSMEMLTKVIQDTIKQLGSAPNKGEPVQDILNAAQTALKPMRIHTLVVQNVRNSLENLRSMSMQLIYAIRSIEGEVILHRKAVDIICGVRNIISLNKIFLQEIATLFELEKSGFLVKQRPKQTSKDYEEDTNIWTFLSSVNTTNWPEQSGTLNSLVLKLTSTESFDSSFQKCFITTYRSFTTPEKLFSKLLERYNVPASQRRVVEPKQVQLRVAIIVKYWFETQIRDFDDILIKELYEFINNRMTNDGHSDVATMLKNALDQTIENDNKKPVAELLKITPNLTPVSPTDLFLQSSPRDMAEQLTLISSSIYRQINLTELLSQAWSKPKTRHKCPNVTALIQRFNQFSFWVPTMILSFDSLRERSQAITKFIQIAKELRNLQNFDGIMGVVAGLTMSPVSRLNFSKLTVSEDLLSYFEELEESMQPSQSWKIYRQALQSCTNQAVPYLGMYLTDLTFIEDGNPDFNTAPDGEQLINFRKRTYVYKVFQEIQVYQSQSYTIEPKEPLASYLRYLPHLSDETLYAMSLIREPRGATIKDLIS